MGRVTAVLPAHHDVAYAVRTGRLVPQPCEVCGAARTDAHHDDYDRPLDVRWLCRTHHSQQHGQRGRRRTDACPKGHPRTPENTYLNERRGSLKPDGTRRASRVQRICRVCTRERTR